MKVLRRTGNRVKAKYQSKRLFEENLEQTAEGGTTYDIKILVFHLETGDLLY